MWGCCKRGMFPASGVILPRSAEQQHWRQSLQSVWGFFKGHPLLEGTALNGNPTAISQKSPGFVHTHAEDREVLEAGLQKTVSVRWCQSSCLLQLCCGFPISLQNFIVPTLRALKTEPLFITGDSCPSCDCSLGHKWLSPGPVHSAATPCSSSVQPPLSVCMSLPEMMWHSQWIKR